MHQLCHGVSLLYNDLLGPVNEGGIGILHSHRDHRSQDVQSLADNGPRLQCMGLQQAVCVCVCACARACVCGVCDSIHVYVNPAMDIIKLEDNQIITMYIAHLWNTCRTILL